MLLSLLAQPRVLAALCPRVPPLCVSATFFDRKFVICNYRRRNLPLVRMASGGGEKPFPVQKQDRQPGKEHVMEPRPQSTCADYKPANKLKGKVALVTGGDSGIGRAVCQSFALEGATVAFTYIKSQEEKDAMEALNILKEAKIDSAKDPLAIDADVGFEANCNRVVDQVIQAYGGIDILVNNAGEQYERHTLEDVKEEDLIRVFRTNIFSQFFLVKAALKHMKKHSCIINTTSVNAYKGHPTLLDYTATKGAIVAFTRALALHVIDKGIRVNAVAPGPVWTPLIPASFPEEKVESFGKKVPMGRAAEPSEIAPSYVFLASEDSSYYSGQVLHPNGGVILNG